MCLNVAFNVACGYTRLSRAGSLKIEGSGWLWRKLVVMGGKALVTCTILGCPGPWRVLEHVLNMPVFIADCYVFFVVFAKNVHEHVHEHFFSSSGL